MRCSGRLPLRLLSADSSLLATWLLSPSLLGLGSLRGQLQALQRADGWMQSGCRLQIHLAASGKWRDALILQPQSHCHQLLL